MAGQPATKAEELQRRMHELVTKNFVTDFEIGQFRREANSVLNADPDMAYMVFGTLAALEGKEEEARSHFKTAIRLSPSQASYGNFALALNRLSYFSEAVVAARAALSLDPANLQVLDGLIDHCLYAGALLEANRLNRQQREALRPEKPHRHAEFIDQSSALMMNNGVADLEIQALQEIASAVLRDHRLGVWGSEFFIQQDDEDRWASIWLHIRSTVDQVVELNIEFAERLAVIEPPPDADRTVGYMFVTADRS